MSSAPAQVVLVDHDADPALVRVDERAAEAISASCTQGPLACIQVPAATAVCRAPCFSARATAQSNPGSCMWMELSPAWPHVNWGSEEPNTTSKVLRIMQQHSGCQRLLQLI